MFGLIFKIVGRIRKLAFALFVGAVGLTGFVYRDHPVVRQLLGRAEQEAEANGIDVAKVEAEAKQVVKTIAADVEKAVAAKADLDRPGTFEVAIAAVRIDPDEFRAGRSAELDVRVIRHPAEDKAKESRGKVVWEAKATARTNKDSDGLLELSWADRPFRVDWTPGDSYTIEVRDRKLLGLAEPTWFALDLGPSGGFPLRSKTHDLKARADGKPTRDPSANEIVVKSHRVESARDRDVVPAVAEEEGDHPRRAARR
jgi:hypothetical protein